MQLFIKSAKVAKNPVFATSTPSVFVSPSGGKLHLAGPSPTSAGVKGGKGAGSRGGKTLGTSLAGKLIYETEKKNRPETGAAGGPKGQTFKEFNKASLSIFIKVDNLVKSVPIGTVHTWTDGNSYKKIAEGHWQPVTTSDHASHPVDEKGNHVSGAIHIDGAHPVGHPWKAQFKKYGIKKNFPPADMSPEDVTVDLEGDIHSKAVLTFKSPTTGKPVKAYTEEFEHRNAQQKFARIAGFDNNAFNSLEKKLVSNFNSKLDYGDPAGENALSAYIILHTGLRPGDRYADKRRKKTEEKIYGVTTLKKWHIEIDNDTISFNFVGKMGITNNTTIKDKRMAAALRMQLAHAGPDGDVFPHTYRKLGNNFLRKLGVEYTYKDFRTRFACKLSASLLDDVQVPSGIHKNPAKLKRFIEKTVKSVKSTVAKFLNNTPRTADESYIHPNVFAAWKENLDPASLEHHWTDLIPPRLIKGGQRSTFNIAINKPVLPHAPIPVKNEVEHYPIPKWIYSSKAILKSLKSTDGKFMRKSIPLFVKGRGLRTEKDDARVVRERNIRYAGTASPSTPDDPAVGQDWHNEHSKEEEAGEDTESSFKTPYTRAKATRKNDMSRSLSLFIAVR